MLSFFIVVFILLIASFSLTLLLNSNLGKVVPYSALGISLLLFIFTAILSSFKLAAYTLVILIGLLFVVAVILFRKALFKKVKNQIMNGLLVYCLVVIFCFVFATLHGSIPTSWDEYMHWGPMVKDVLHNDYFYITENSGVYIHADYPPIIVLFNTFGMIFQGSFSPFCMFSSMFLLQSVMIMPIVKEDNKQTHAFIYAVLIISFIYLFELGLGEGFFCTINQDCILGLVAGLALYNALWSKINYKYWLSNFVLMSSLLMIKQFAMVFVLIIIALIIVRLYREQKTCLLNWIYLILTCIAAFFPIALWKFIYLKSYAAENIVTQFVLPSFGTINSLLYEYLHNAITITIKFFIILFSGSFLPYLPIAVTFFVVLLVMPILIFKIFNKSNNKVLFTCIIIISLVFYAVCLLLTYIFIFKGLESIQLASIHRYLSSVILAVVSCVYVSIFSFYNNKLELLNQKDKWIIVVVPILLCLFFPSILQKSSINTYTRSDTSKMTEELVKTNCSSENEVFIIDKNLTIKDTWEDSYFLDDYRISYICNNSPGTFATSNIFLMGYRGHVGSLKELNINNSNPNIDDNVIKEIFYNKKCILTGNVPLEINEIFNRLYGKQLEDNKKYIYENGAFTLQ